MKKYFLLSLVSINLFALSAQESFESSEYFPEPKIDQRIELLSIVFRLAGNREYSSDVYSSYAQDIYSHFNRQKDHPVISFASKLRVENGVSYDAVMKMAFHINQAPALTPKVQFSKNVPEKRWGTGNATEFLVLLRDFYGVSDFEGFYDEHNEMYEIARKRFSSVYNAVHIEWFNRYYGVEPGASFHVIISLGNGGSSYGGKIIYPGGEEEAYSILGTWNIDRKNLPIYPVDNYLPTLVHEFNHSYVNKLVDKYENQLEPSGRIIFEPIRDQMKRQAYSNWKTMMCESLVRASVIRYLLEYSSDNEAEKKMKSDTDRGFYWMKDLVNLLDKYESNRTQYKSMEEFMIEIVQFYNNLAIETQ